MAFAHAEAIERSLELAADACADLTPLIYERLFARLPETEALFVRDTTGAIKGEMLAKVFEAILDYVGERRYAQQMIGNEAVTHAQYEVPEDMFAIFFAVVADTVKGVVGPDWTPEMDGAWTSLLTELDLYIRNGTGPTSRVAAAL